MLDFILGLALAGLLVRGWTRGFVREALDLVGLILGVWIAFRLSGPLGEFLTDRFGVAPEVAGVGAGILLFVLFGVAMSVAARYLSKVMNLPGLTMINRVGGAAVALGWGVVIVLVLINLAGVLPLPPVGIRPSRTPRWPKRSPGLMHCPSRLSNLWAPVRCWLRSRPSSRFSVRAGRCLRATRSSSSRAPASTRSDRCATRPPKSWSGSTSTGPGRVWAHSPPVRFSPKWRRRGRQTCTPPGESPGTPHRGEVSLTTSTAAGVRPTLAGENIALASSVRAAFEGMLESPTAIAQFNIPSYNRAGVAVVEGPTGRLVVVVLGA